MRSLREEFQARLTEIARELVQMHGLRFTESVENLNDPLYRWIDFRLRYIDPIPRKLLWSDRFPKHVAPEVDRGLKIVASRMREGRDVNAYQSKGLTRFNDSSGKNASKRTDLLWADWGVTHLHITDVPIAKADQYAQRDCSNGESWLLFCLFAGDTVGILDLKPHDESSVFSNQELLRILKDNWPDWLEYFRLNGIEPGDDRLTDEQIATLRCKGVNTPIVIDGEVFMGPGKGLASACTPMLVTEWTYRLRVWVNHLADVAKDEDGEIVTELRKRNVQKPRLSLCLTSYGIAVCDKKNELLFVIDFDESGDLYSAEMESLICPEWVRAQIPEQESL